MTDDHSAYDRLPFAHASVRHSTRQYVDGMAHTNGLEPFWVLIERGYHGAFCRNVVQHITMWHRVGGINRNPG